MGLLQLLPRRAAGLPPGQRELTVMPRFSNDPLRPLPSLESLAFTIAIDGREIVRFDESGPPTQDRVEQVCDFHCVTTWSVKDLRWSGLPLAALVEAAVGRDSAVTSNTVSPQAVPPHAVATGADGQRAIFLTEDLLAPDVLIATHLNGEKLDRRHGAPLRLVCPRQYGYKNLKHLTSIDFVSDRPHSSLGPKEHLRARVDREERHATLPSRLVRLPYRLAIVPTALAAERGLRKPSTDQGGTPIR